LFFFVRCARGGFSEFPLLLNAVFLILIVVDKRVSNSFHGVRGENAIRIANEAARILEWDTKTREEETLDFSVTAGCSMKTF
jgi:hypothetical protein